MSREDEQQVALLEPLEEQVATQVRPGSKKQTNREQQTRKQPPYGVILHNDDLNSMEFVVQVLQKVFGFSLHKASWYMLQAHFMGTSVIWSGSMEVAELKSEQVRSCGPDPAARNKGATPVITTVEPLPE